MKLNMDPGVKILKSFTRIQHLSVTCFTVGLHWNWCKAWLRLWYPPLKCWGHALWLCTLVIIPRLN